MTRLEFWKTRGLEAKESRAIADIEEHGCHIISVTGSPPWCYSVGSHDQTGGPELIVFGLEPAVAQFVINETFRQAREEGLALTSGSVVKDLLEGDFVCALRPVLPKWYDWLVGWDLWFYGSRDFPMLQCVWPDKSGFYPWQAEFRSDWKPFQPMLDREDESDAHLSQLIQAMRESEGSCTCREPVD
ncbi:MAG: DUF4262 domain-containing protein [Acidobacteria bacterium]|nr:DUF4262 domain-containing protein [Acidobacteriota bacterium]